MHWKTILGLVLVALVAAPLLANPAGWIVAALLVVVVLLVVYVAPWGLRELLDLKKHRESGIRRADAGDTDSERKWQR